MMLRLYIHQVDLPESNSNKYTVLLLALAQECLYDTRKRKGKNKNGIRKI